MRANPQARLSPRLYPDMCILTPLGMRAFLVRDVRDMRFEPARYCWPWSSAL